MAPSVVVSAGHGPFEVGPVTKSGTTYDSGPYKDVDQQGPRGFKQEAELAGTKKFAPATYPHYLPTWELTGPKENGGVYYPLEPFEHYEHGHDADPAFPNLFPKGAAKTKKLTPLFGTEVRNVQLSKLSDAGKNELALFVAQRGVVAFRDQDFADLPIQEALDFGGYFGRHHIHPASGQPEGYPEIHLVHRGAEEKRQKSILDTRTSSVAIHSDVTYEEQPPGTTFLYILDMPVDDDGEYVGGDTLFVSQTEAYNRLSEPFKKLLWGLKATHSSHEQAGAAAARGGVVRRKPVTSTHPIVRQHPVTKQKALFVNPQFTRNIVGFKQEESDAILKLLYDHITSGIDFQARVQWEPKTVVVWDNRVTAHSALLDWDNGARRHLARITPQAERPQESFD